MKVLAFIDHMLLICLVTKTLNLIVTQLFTTGGLLVISRFLFYDLILLCQKVIIINSTYYFILKFLNKREFQQIAINDS